MPRVRPAGEIARSSPWGLSILREISAGPGDVQREIGRDILVTDSRGIWVCAQLTGTSSRWPAGDTIWAVAYSSSVAPSQLRVKVNNSPALTRSAEY